MLTMVDNATNHVGTNVSLELFLERQPDLTGNGVTATIQGGACREDFVDVPANAISLTIDRGRRFRYSRPLTSPSSSARRRGSPARASSGHQHARRVGDD